MQNIIFKILHPIAPFTYSIKGIREIFYEPDIGVIFENMAILLVFPTITLSAGLLINN